MRCGWGLQEQAPAPAMREEIAGLLRDLRDGSLREDAFDRLAAFCDRNPGIDPLSVMPSVCACPLCCPTPYMLRHSAA